MKFSLELLFPRLCRKRIPTWLPACEEGKPWFGAGIKVGKASGRRYSHGSQNGIQCV